jgi:L-amino acid N-acyltransferase YncA
LLRAEFGTDGGDRLLHDCLVGAVLAQLVIRAAEIEDAAELLAIYRPFVEQTAVSFEVVAPTTEEFAARIAGARAGWAWLVAELHGQPIGYAYASSHRERSAYRWSVETSAYVHPSHHRKGAGRRLYLALFDELSRKGFCNALAGVTLPNKASVAFHQGLGFEPIGIFKSVGWKFGSWQDVAWFQRRLRDSPPE